MTNQQIEVKQLRISKLKSELCSDAQKLRASNPLRKEIAAAVKDLDAAYSRLETKKVLAPTKANISKLQSQIALVSSQLKAQNARLQAARDAKTRAADDAAATRYANASNARKRALLAATTPARSVLVGQGNRFK